MPASAAASPMTRYATSPDTQLDMFGGSPQKKPAQLTKVVRKTEGQPELVHMLWGLEPRSPGERPAINIRAEGRQFTRNRCLIPANYFRLRDHSGTRWQFFMRGDELFYLAGIWREASEDWPEAYAAITIEANPDVAPYHDRQMAVILSSDVMAWLDHSVPQEELLRPLPAGTFEAFPTR